MYGREMLKKTFQVKMMGRIIGVGTDIIEMERVLKYCQKDSFLRKYYTEAERELIAKKKERAAGNFAGKEAVVKAFGTGFLNCMPGEIEILRDEYGKPYVNLLNNAKRIAEEKGIKKIHISLSDIEKLAVAYAIAEGE